MKTRAAALWLLVLLLTATLPAQERAPYNASIRGAHLRADLFFLAGDAMQGRLTDTPENLLAAEFIKARFERLDLTPAAPDGSYFQHYNLMTAGLGDDNQLVVSGDGVELRLPAGQDFFPRRFSASGRARAGLVFAGFGMTVPHLGYDDYGGELVKGRIVLVLEHEPREGDADSPFDGVVTTEPSVPWRKALAAQERGAAGILFVTDVHNHPGPGDFGAQWRAYWPDPPPRIERYMLAAWTDRLRIPAAQISTALAETLVRGTGRTLEHLARSAETATGLTPVALPGVEVELTTSVRRQIVADRNIVASIEGADPRVRDEWVVVGAHYDHNGADGALVFNGADDNGSGVVGLLAIAEAYALAAQDGHRPRRSVLFAAWNTEERGLLGAWAYTEQPLAPLDKTVAVVNLDMIGRNEEVPAGGGPRFRGLEIQTAESNGNAVNVLGYSRSPDLRALVERANGAHGLDLRFRYDNNLSNLLRRSDQWPFLQRGVPAIWFHTGLHPDYHTIYDVPEKIEYEKMERIVRLVHQLSWDLAQQDQRPRLQTRR